MVLTCKKEQARCTRHDRRDALPTCTLGASRMQPSLDPRNGQDTEAQALFLQASGNYYFPPMGISASVLRDKWL